VVRDLRAQNRRKVSLQTLENSPFNQPLVRSEKENYGEGEIVFLLKGARPLKRRAIH
jgi:hypothetical protein